MGMFGQQKPDKPSDERAEPVRERMTGTVLPGGRGQELHGVQMSGSPDLVDDIEMGDVVVMPPERDEPDPIPVRVISSSKRELVKWRVITIPLISDEPARLIVGQDDRRTSLRIKNTTAVGVAVIGAEAHLTSNAMGFPLAAGAEVTLSVETAVYGIASGAEDVTLAILVEYTVEVDA